MQILKYLPSIPLQKKFVNPDLEHKSLKEYNISNLTGTKLPVISLILPGHMIKIHAGFPTS